MKINLFWFRRDLRLDDNTALNHALTGDIPVMAIFIFDTDVIDELTEDDPGISFIYDKLFEINNELLKHGSSLLIMKGDPESVWRKLIDSYNINAVYINKDYEPYSISRDHSIEVLLHKESISLFRFKDHVIFEETEILKSDRTPYTIFTPYKNKWLQKISDITTLNLYTEENVRMNYFKHRFTFLNLEELGFRESLIRVRPFDLSVIGNYEKYRDFPSEDKTTYLGPHLRFGTISIRNIVKIALSENAGFLSQLIWREFFMQILFNFPYVVTGNFRSKYDNVAWRINETEFELWCNGQTGFPMVDAGMRQLNKTGYMHNRIRMITAGFLCKQLLIDWRWGEAYFATKLLDYELSSNNGNWQWAAGTGCDAAPYFRVFNPQTQLQKYDHHKNYCRMWIEELDKSQYPKPMLDLNPARERVISAFKTGLKF
jgi:deoxyribodipyrimidine photo-lyase